MSILSRLKHNKTLSIMPTFRCTAECRHCGTVSSPRENTWLEPALMLKAIEQAVDEGYKVVVFTGGEPTLAGDILLAGIRKASSRGVVVRIVTNAHWASNNYETEVYVSELVASGLTEINFSTGDQHARFVPLDNVIRATKYSVKSGLNVAIMVETVRERKITKEVVEQREDFQAIFAEVPTAIIKLHESPWMPLSPKSVTEYPDKVAINASNVSMCKGCDSILSTTTIQADGIIGACCGLGMRLIPELHTGKVGTHSIAEVDRIAADDFLKRWIRIEGPEKILAWASEHEPSIQWENMYAHRCQACIRIYKDPQVRRIIMQRHQEKMADVLMTEWLLYHHSIENDAVDEERKIAASAA